MTSRKAASTLTTVHEPLTMTPDFRVSVTGQGDVTKAIRERLLSLRVSDEEGYRSDTVEIRLDDRGGTVELPRRGAELTVELGYDKVPEAEQRNGLKPGRVPMGRYTVDEVELSGPPAALAIRDRAADMRAAMKQRRTRSWQRVLLGDHPRLAQLLAGAPDPQVVAADRPEADALRPPQFLEPGVGAPGGLDPGDGRIAEPSVEGLADLPRELLNAACGGYRHQSPGGRRAMPGRRARPGRSCRSAAQT